MACRLLCGTPMKQILLLSVAATTLASCQLPSVLRPKGDDVGGGPATMNGTPVETGGDPAVTGRTAKVDVDSDLCGPDPEGDPEAGEHRRRLRETTTLCTIIKVEPVAGVATIAPRSPGWCDQIPEEELDGARLPSATSGMEALVAEKYWWATTRDILGPLCRSPDDAAVKQQTASLYQWWVNRTGLAPEQLDGWFRYFATVPGGDTSRYATAMEAACKAFPAATEEDSERERLLRGATRASLGCADSDGAPVWVSGTHGDDVAWALDALETPPSELVRAYAVLQCLDEPDEIDDRALAAYAACGSDARALDAAALEQQTAAYPELARAQARLTFAAARRIAARYEAVARARAAEDPAWKRVLFDAPADGWKAWTTAYASHRADIDAARAYEARYTGASRKAARGCWDDTYGRFASYVASARPSGLDGVKKAMTDPVGTILLESVVACADAEKQELAAATFGSLFGAARPARGPRYAAYFATLDALSDIRADRDRFPLEPDALARFFSPRSPVARWNGGAIAELDLARDDAGGVVKKVSRAGDGVRVEFKTDRWKAPYYACTPNNRILQFRPDGTPVYGSDCVYKGEQWYEQTHDPIWVPASLAGGIKAGTFVRSNGSIERHDGAWDSIPVEVYADKSRDRLVAYLGVTL